MNIKVINAGNCMICGKPINPVVSRDNGKLPDIFFCPRCAKQIVKKGKPQIESEEEHDD